MVCELHLTKLIKKILENSKWYGLYLLLFTRLEMNTKKFKLLSHLKIINPRDAHIFKSCIFKTKAFSEHNGIVLHFNKSM